MLAEDVEFTLDANAVNVGKNNVVKIS